MRSALTLSWARWRSTSSSVQAAICATERDADWPAAVPPVARPDALDGGEGISGWSVWPFAWPACARSARPGVRRGRGRGRRRRRSPQSPALGRVMAVAAGARARPAALASPGALPAARPRAAAWPAAGRRRPPRPQPRPHGRQRHQPSDHRPPPPSHRRLALRRSPALRVDDLVVGLATAGPRRARQVLGVGRPAQRDDVLALPVGAAGPARPRPGRSPAP